MPPVNEKTKAIESRFAKARNDGEFIDRNDAPFSVFGPGRSNAPIIFATKPGVVANSVRGRGLRRRLGIIGRYGLPRPSDVLWINRVAHSNELFYLGDLDPPDLMIFAWLREKLLPKPIRNLGISDAYLTHLNAVLPPTFVMQCSPSERRALKVLRKVFPDLAETVGAVAAQLLREGRKIELEAVVSAIPRGAPIIPKMLAEHVVGVGERL